MGSLNQLMNSYKKTIKLKKISLVLGNDFLKGNYVENMSNDLRKYGYSDYLARRKELAELHLRAEEELFTLVEFNSVLANVMLYHGANRETLKSIYDSFIGYGWTCQWVRGDYIPASVLAFAAPLEYLLRHKEDLLSADENGQKVCFKVLHYFEMVDTSPYIPN